MINYKITLLNLFGFTRRNPKKSITSEFQTKRKKKMEYSSLLYIGYVLIYFCS